MAKKILLISGHGAGDPGAIGNGFKEADLTVELMDLVAKKLSTYDFEVTKYPANRNAYADIKNGQWQVGWKFDYVFEIHFNAGGGVGVEIYVTNAEKAVTVETEVVNSIAKLGFRNRGVKKMDFLVIKTVKNKGISSALVETCFIDSKSDMDLYVAKKNEVASAIADGIAKGFGVSGKKPEVVPAPAPEKEKPTTTGGYTGNSIVDYLNFIGVDSSYTNRVKLAKEYGIANYAGTSKQNLNLLDAMRNKKVVEKPVAPVAPTPTTNYYPAVNKGGIVASLKAIGVDSSYANRTKIARVNGIVKYEGTWKQNDDLATLLAQGKLRKV